MPLTPWTQNLDWVQPIPRGKLCGRISDRFISCTHRKPCPVHDQAGASTSPSEAPAAGPAPRFFDSTEAE